MLKRVTMRWDINVFVVRQVFINIAVCLLSYTTGMVVAFPSILNPAILAPDSNIKVTPDQASWIVTCLGLGGLVGFTFVPAVFEIFGRKMANIISNLLLLIGSLMLYVANDVYALAFARLTQGLSIGGTFTISSMTLCECVSPKRRGYFLVISKVCFGLGSLACHGFVFVMSWREVALCGALANVISIIIFTISAESPFFLAMRGQFDECAVAFQWYRGDTLNAKTELKELISAQTENLRIKERQKEVSVFRKIKDMLMTKEFRKSFYIVTLATLCLDSCGRYVVLAYITQILTELTNDESLAMHISIGTDLTLIFALSISTIFVKYFKRRSLLFNLGFCSVFLMFMVSFSIILRSNVSFLSDVKWLTLSVILLQIFVTNIGLVPIAFALTGEVYSLEQRGLGSVMSGTMFLIFFNLVMKLTPIMIDKTGVEGTYSIYAVLLFVFLLLLKCILPETKDKTLQEIEDEIKGVVRNNCEIELLKQNNNDSWKNGRQRLNINFK